MVAGVPGRRIDMTTLSIIKAATGGFVGQTAVRPAYLRRHGPFEPHRLGLEEMEYTTLSSVGTPLADRWQPLDDLEAVAEHAPIGAGVVARS
jgi:fructose 1,6-bisphosphatase